MSNYREMVRLALRDQNPQLYREMEKSGQLSPWVVQYAEEMAQQVTDLSMQDHAKANNLPHLQRLAMFTQQQNQAQELVFSEMLQFRALKSLPSQDETTTSPGLPTYPMRAAGSPKPGRTSPR